MIDPAALGSQVVQFLAGQFAPVTSVAWAWDADAPELISAADDQTLGIWSISGLR